MKIITERKGGTLIMYLFGDLDHHAARKAIPEINRTIDTELPIDLIMDFKNISFMDSSGIALVIGAYKRSNSIGCSFKVINVSKQAFKVFNAACICKIVNINEADTILIN